VDIEAASEQQGHSSFAGAPSLPFGALLCRNLRAGCGCAKTVDVERETGLNNCSRKCSGRMKWLIAGFSREKSV
jgi:hypothetical protein